jgi:protein O-GlcNAc transferase
MVPPMNDAGSRIDALIAQGVGAQNARRYAEAERAYRAALQIDPTDPRALALLGTLAGMAGRFPMAIDLFSKALQRDPSNADLYHNLGETYRQLGDTGKALPAFNRAIELRPDHFEAYRSAADAALAAAEQAKGPDSGIHARELRRIAAMYLLKLGHRRHGKGLGGIEAIFREAAALDPDNPEILSGLGAAVQDSGLPTEAVALLQRAIALGSKNAETYTNLGTAFYTLSRWEEMEAAYRTALTLDPSFAPARRNFGTTSLMRWLYAETTPEVIFDRHRAWDKQVAAELGAAAKKLPVFANSCDPNRRLRIAYLSGDFRNHSVGYFFSPLLAHHDPAEVEVFCYSGVDRPDSVTASLRQFASTWRDTVKLDDEALRECLRADEIDIAIDLSGHTAMSRLRALAVKATPVTATWLGYPATTGLATIDWRITDAIADPPGAERFYTEKLLRLADGFLCYEAPARDVPEVAPAPAEATGRVTFGSFNNPQKLLISTIAAWASILASVPDSRLLLKALTFADPGLRRHVVDLFATQGIGAERLEFRGFAATSASHLATYAEVDIALDPFPYNGTTTSCEAMWMGVPIVTLIGDRHSGRVGLDLLTRVGLSDLAAPDLPAYVAAAAALAQDLPRLRQIRRALRERMRASTLCDGKAFTSAFEGALRHIWRQWCGRSVIHN